jgi:hypothetical protein
MSYDIWLEADLGGPERIEVFEVGNYTSNVSPMWNLALQKAGELRMKDLHDRQCGTVIDPLTRAIEYMKNNPDEFRAMNPPNSWGKYEGALEYLEELLRGCKAAPDAYIYVSS